MVANQILIMMGIKFLLIFQPGSFQNLLKKEGWKKSFLLDCFRFFHTLSYLIFSFFILCYALVFSLKYRA
jgi:hypothetical protein